MCMDTIVKKRFFRCCIFILILLTGCTLSRQLSIETDSGKQDTISNTINGCWEVWDFHSAAEFVGILTFDGSSYEFELESGSEISSKMGERFSFINQPIGSVTFNWMNSQPDARITEFEDNDILVTCSFNDQGESFFIRINTTEKQLYFHSMISELQQYHVFRSYDE